MVNIISRSSWGARAPKNRQTVAWSARQEVTLHYSTGSTSQTPRQIQDFHMGPSRGWSDIAYNFLVDKDGKVYKGRGWLVVGAHAAPRNTQGIGVCYIGSDSMTDAAKRAVVALYDEACKRAGRTLSRRGHRDINSTSCPGSKNHAWWKSSSFRSVGSGSAPAPSKPKPKPGAKAPAFPLKAGHWYGPESSNVRNHSGYHASARPGVRQIRDRLRERGWRVATGDRYDAALASVIRQFQREKNLAVDGLTGAQTWRALWEAPIT
ncbi:peptidoglycan-binding domain-containing protein [Nocardiopsis eucommiae]|uniref:Peptidoglycan-binding domain-containing protein n=1 Tax=Nocardiopsis eucommiae TaxID=2831970 RepID=A0A975LDA8_9ACTN|nr:peptidoglycan-binding domain-containing protein [Nocardiopsis eucommiae]